MQTLVCVRLRRPISCEVTSRVCAVLTVRLPSAPKGEAPPVIAMQGVLALKLLEFSNQFAGNFLTVAV